jgi:sec-independent protein translocase protein TatB
VVFGIGPEELVDIGLLALVVFGPQKLQSMARDLGRFVNKSHHAVEELKSEFLTEGEANEIRRTAKAVKREFKSR